MLFKCYTFKYWELRYFSFSILISWQATSVCHITTPVIFSLSHMSYSTVHEQGILELKGQISSGLSASTVRTIEIRSIFENFVMVYQKNVMDWKQDFCCKDKVHPLYFFELFGMTCKKKFKITCCIFFAISLSCIVKQKIEKTSVLTFKTWTPQGWRKFWQLGIRGKRFVIPKAKSLTTLAPLLTTRTLQQSIVILESLFT